jgi:hypothetical protein
MNAKSLWLGLISLSAGVVLVFNLDSVMGNISLLPKLVIQTIVVLMIFGGLALVALSSREGSKTQAKAAKK